MRTRLPERRRAAQPSLQGVQDRGDRGRQGDAGQVQITVALKVLLMGRRKRRHERGTVRGFPRGGNRVELGSGDQRFGGQQSEHRKQCAENLVRRDDAREVEHREDDRNSDRQVGVEVLPSANLVPRAPDPRHADQGSRERAFRWPSRLTAAAVDIEPVTGPPEDAPGMSASVHPRARPGR